MSRSGGDSDAASPRAPSDGRSPGQTQAEQAAPRAAGVLTAKAAKDAVAEIWLTLLPPGCYPEVNDNFFDVGGSSRMLPELLRRLVDRVGVSLRMVDLFNLPTIASQAARIVAEVNGDPTSAEPGSEAADVGSVPVGVPSMRLTVPSS